MQNVQAKNIFPHTLEPSPTWVWTRASISKDIKHQAVYTLFHLKTKVHATVEIEYNLSEAPVIRALNSGYSLDTIDSSDDHHTQVSIITEDNSTGPKTLSMNNMIGTQQSDHLYCVLEGTVGIPGSEVNLDARGSLI